ncbi:MAG TPA: vitamin K epoxide reductase family protein [Candidatus Nanoarchaeia archaeon]|nr:vitamin K epoxide reductase family protein [Candidatus Nanoarchaeia archaeon]
MHLDRRLHWLRLFSFVGLLISAFLTYEYYNPQPSTLCTVGDYFVCSLSTSSYSSVDSIFYFLSVDLGLALPAVSFPMPHSLLFFLSFLFLLITAFHAQHQEPVFGLSSATALFWNKRLFFVLAGYSVFLTYVETYFLYTLCLFCLLVTFLIFASLWILVAHTVQQPRGTSTRRKRK